MKLNGYELPPHKAALHLTHNQHLAYYQSAEEYASEYSRSFISDEQREKSIATNEIWELQWYPGTPVGCHIIMASDLDALLAHAERWSGK